MQKSLFIISILLIILIFSYPETITGKINGSPGGKTNSPVDGSNCTSCHSGTINSGPGNINITSDVPLNGYTPGETYTITTNISETGTNTFGFELTAEGGVGFNPKIGEFAITDAIQTKLTNSNSAVTHTSAGLTGNGSKLWTVNWTAPSQIGEGTIAFFASGIAANGNQNNSGDNVYTTLYVIDEHMQSTSLNDYSDIFNIYYSNNLLTISNNTKLNQLLIYDINGRLISNFDSNIPTYINTASFTKGNYIINYSDINNNKYSKNISIY